MRTLPLFFGKKFISLAFWKDINHWYLFPSLELEFKVPLGSNIYASRFILSWLLWHVCIELGKSELKFKIQNIKDIDWSDFLLWCERKNPGYNWNFSLILSLLEQNVHLKKLILQEGIASHYLKLMLLRVLMENEKNNIIPTSDSFSLS